MWSERAKEVAKALKVLGWTHIVRAKEDCEEPEEANRLWILQSKGDPVKNNDALFFGWDAVMGHVTILDNVCDMHYDVTTDSPLDYKLWEQVGRTPIRLEEIING